MKLIAMIRCGGEKKQIEAKADTYLSAREALWAQVPVGWTMLLIRRKQGQVGVKRT